MIQVGLAKHDGTSFNQQLDGHGGALGGVGKGWTRGGGRHASHIDVVFDGQGETEQWEPRAARLAGFDFSDLSDQFVLGCTVDPNPTVLVQGGPVRHVHDQIRGCESALLVGVFNGFKSKTRGVRFVASRCHWFA